jgi:hypothetical protein
MSFPIKTCVVCSEEFELKPDKPGFANRCPSCSEPEAVETDSEQASTPFDRRAINEVNEARRKAMRDLLYRKES